MSTLIGPGIDRVDAPAKVCGAAPYTIDVTYPDLAHAAVVRSTIASGRVIAIDDAAARAASGVLTVITHETAPEAHACAVRALGAGATAASTGRPHQPPRTVRCRRRCSDAARGHRGGAPGQGRLRVRRPAADWTSTTRAASSSPRPLTPPHGAGMSRPALPMQTSFTRPPTPLPITPTTRSAFSRPSPRGTATPSRCTTRRSGPPTRRRRSPKCSAFRPAAVRVHAPYVGGAFGAGLFVWQHVILAVVAARAVGRPVKLVLTRPQMFTGVGHRPSSAQTIRMGARHDGELVAIEHVSTNSAAIEHASIEPISGATARSYACANVATSDRQRRLNIALPGSMRGPGHAQGNFALESAIDELAYKLGLDPLELRLSNYAEVHPQSGLPWSSNALRECYALGAERFGWAGRNPEIGSMRDGHWKIGYGLAALSWSWWQVRCQARATISGDGHAAVSSAASDPGTGTRTVMHQLAGERLGLPLDHVRFELGDSDMPWSPASGGSGLTASLGNAVLAVCDSLVQRFLDTVAETTTRPCAAARSTTWQVGDGRIHRRDDPRAGERYTDILARHGLDELTADAEATPRARRTLT